MTFRPVHLMAALVLLFALPQCRVLAQSSPCPPGPKLLATSDPIYADAMEQSRTLEANGFTVQCVFPTKLRSMFEEAYGRLTHSTIAGEASFETNYGYVDVVFLPKGRTFADFKIIERREGSGYFYTFASNPRVWDGRLETGRRLYFLKHDNHLLFVDDAKLRALLEKALHVSWQAP